MIVARPVWLAIAAVALTGAWGQGPAQVTVDARQLPIPATATPTPSLACSYRLHDVIDARANGKFAGGFGNEIYQLEEVATAVREQLAVSGLRASEGEGTAVTVRVLQLYLVRSYSTRMPVALYEVGIDGEPPFLVRSQIARFNGSDRHAIGMTALATAMGDANQQLIRRLNAKCTGSATSAHQVATPSEPVRP